MRGAIVDSNIILDIFENDPKWLNRSESTLDQYSMDHILYINPVIYSEVSIGFERIEELEKAIEGCGFQVLEIPKEALFLAGKTFLQYRRRKGAKISPLPDFFIGAHATIAELKLITRDTKRIQTYFPNVHVISPSS